MNWWLDSSAQWSEGSGTTSWLGLGLLFILLHGRLNGMFSRIFKIRGIGFMPLYFAAKSRQLLYVCQSELYMIFVKIWWVSPMTEWYTFNCHQADRLKYWDIMRLGKIRWKCCNPMDTGSLFIFFSGATKVASITPLGEWLHDYKAGETNSRMQLRQGAVLSQFTQQYPGGKAKDSLW